MRVNGRIIKWKVEDCLLGLTTGDMKGSILTIKKRARVFFTGQMAENMRESGKMESNMVLGFTLQHQARPRRDNGQKERELHGFDKFLLILVN